MTRANKALAVFVVAALGLWGCAQGTTNGTSHVERIRILESKCAKLEDDYRAVASIRDTLRRKLNTTEEERSHLQDEQQKVETAYRAEVSAGNTMRKKLATLEKKQTRLHQELQKQLDEYHKLEAVYQTLISTRDTLCNKLDAQEKKNASLQQELDDHQPLLQERISLLKQVSIRTSERDALQSQLKHLRKGMRSLLGQVEAALGNSVQPATAAAVTTSPGKS